MVCLTLPCFSQENQQRKNNIDISASRDYRKSYAVFRDMLIMLNAFGRLDATSDRLFFNAPLTQELYRKSTELLPLHRQMWRDPAVSKELKIKSAQMAQCFSKKDRLILINEVFSAFKAGAVPDYVVSSFLAPGSEWNSWLYINYADAEVQKVLKRIVNDPASSKKIVETILSILDGTGAEFIREYGPDIAQKLNCHYERNGKSSETG